MPGEGSRSAMEIGPGDYVKVPGGGIKKVASNTCFGDKFPPKEGWTITTVDGLNYDMISIRRYYKKGDSDLPI